MDPVTQIVRDGMDMIKNSLDLQNMFILLVTMIVGVFVQKVATKTWRWLFTAKSEVPMQGYVQDIIELLENYPTKWNLTAYGNTFGERNTSLYTLSYGICLSYDEHGDFCIVINGENVINDLAKRERKAIIKAATVTANTLECIANTNKKIAVINKVASIKQNIRI